MSQCNQDWSRQRRLAKMSPMLQAEREHELLLLAQRGDAPAIEALVASHMRLVVSIAGRHARRTLSAHDLVAEGTLGLLEAIQRYDCQREVRFATYAVFWIRAYVSRYALANRRIVGAPSTRAGRKTQARLHRTERQLTAELGRFPSRAELAAALEVAEEDVQAVYAAGSDLPLSHEGVAEPLDPSPQPDMLVADCELRAQRDSDLSRALASLTLKEQAVISQQLLDEPRSLSELARELGVSRQRTGQIAANAREKLRQCMVQVA